MYDDAISSRLMPGERIVWTGKPKQGILFSPRDVFLVPFSLMWGGFAIFWEASVLGIAAHVAPGHNPIPVIFPLFGIPFVLVGLFLIFGRFLLDASLRRHTVYALTDRRILIMRSGTMNRFTSVSLDRLPDVSLSESRDGTGTITFGAQTSTWGHNSFSGWLPSLDSVPRFLRIEQAQNVFDRVQQLSGQPAAQK